MYIYICYFVIIKICKNELNEYRMQMYIYELLYNYKFLCKIFIKFFNYKIWEEIDFLIYIYYFLVLG